MEMPIVIMCLVCCMLGGSEGLCGSHVRGVEVEGKHIVNGELTQVSMITDTNLSLICGTTTHCRLWTEKSGRGGADESTCRSAGSDR